MLMTMKAGGWSGPVLLYCPLLGHRLSSAGHFFLPCRLLGPFSVVIFSISDQSKKDFYSIIVNCNTHKQSQRPASS